MKRSLVVLAVVSLVFAGVAGAEVRKGDIQLDFLGGWTQQNLSGDIGGGHTSLLFAALRPGIALTDNIRVAGVAGYLHEDAAGFNTDVLALGVSGEYVLMPTNQLNPYVGGMVAWANASKGFNSATGVTLGSSGTGADGWLFAPRVGVLFTLNRTNNLFAEYQYQMYTGGIDKIVNNGNMVLLGIEHKFKVGQ